ncbi:MAG: bifunctional nuclease family protein [Muribaculaceae bacterium]|nr:bifunctional nuclease family protein [Muribaculaceae bacterium]
MEKRVLLRVMGLSYNQIQDGAYALILAQVGGPYRIPVVIGTPEAQSIAIRMEGITTPRPLTHDLFVSFAHAFGVRLVEVFIYKFEDGIFSSELTFTDGERQMVIDSRTSDAIAIAMRTKAPIYTTREILHETGFILDIRDSREVDNDGDNEEDDDFDNDSDEGYEDDSRENESHPDDHNRLSEEFADALSPDPLHPDHYLSFTTQQLHVSLREAIEAEDYEVAALIKAEIERRPPLPLSE